MKRAMLATLTLTLLAGPALAQEAADTFDLEELVVTATRVPLPRAATTAAVSVVTGDELRARGAALLDQALRGLPGIGVAATGSHGGQTSLYVRGGESDYVHVLVDGVPVNQPGGSLDLANLSIENVERVEVVRGPVSVLYGSDAMTGVVQIFTRRGEGATSAWAGAGAGVGERVGPELSGDGERYALRELEAGVSGAAGPAGYSLAVARFDSDGAYAFNNDYARTVLSGRVDLRPDDRTDARLSARYTEGEYHYPTDGSGLLVDRNAFQDNRLLTLGLDAGRWLSRALELRALVSASALDSDIDDAPDEAADTLGFFAYRSRQELQRRSLDLRANYHLAAATVLTAGAEVERQEERSSNESRSEWGPSSGATDVSRGSRALYAQAVGGIADVRLQAGIRAEDSETFGGFTTYRLGAAYEPLDGTRLRAAYGTGFKEPSFYENFAEGFVTGNPDLDPERSRSWEAGVEQTLADGRVALGATYFDQRFEDLIEYVNVPFGSGEPNYLNIGRADADGVELTARASAAGGLVLGGSFTALSTEVLEAGADNAVFAVGERLLRRPARAAALHAGWRGAGGGLRVDWTWTGERDDLDFSGWPAQRVELPAFQRVDLAGEVRVVSGRGAAPALTLNARVENLLDERYQEVANYPGRRRTVVVGVRVGSR